MVRDAQNQSGKYRRTQLFLLTLGYSRKSVRLPMFRYSSQTWAELHEKSFPPIPLSGRAQTLRQHPAVLPRQTIPTARARLNRASAMPRELRSTVSLSNLIFRTSADPAGP